MAILQRNSPQRLLLSCILCLDRKLLDRLLRHTYAQSRTGIARAGERGGGTDCTTADMQLVDSGSDYSLVLKGGGN